MATRRHAGSTPDLFASLPTARAPEQPSSPRATGVEPRAPVTRPPPLLPKDLAGALTRLADTEIDDLLTAVTAEVDRRGRLAPPTAHRGRTEARSRPRKAPSDPSATSLTTGKLNAVRAAFKAGVRTSAIARQFGISQADVKKALAAEGRKAGR